VVGIHGDSSPRAVPPGTAAAALASTETRLLAGGSTSWAGFILAVALGTVWNAGADSRWAAFGANSGRAALVLAGFLLLVGHLAASRDHRHGAAEFTGTLPVPRRRRTVALLALVPVAAAAGALAEGVQLLLVIPSGLTGRFDPWLVAVPFLVPMIGAALGVAAGLRWPSAVGHMVFYRFLFAVLAMLPVLALHPPSFDRKDWKLLLLGAFLGVPVQFLVQFKGLSLTTVSHAALMVGTMPVILAVGATFLEHERLDSVGWISLIVSTAGATLIAVGGRHSHAAGDPVLSGDLLVVLSLVIALFWVLCNKRLVARHPALLVTAYSLFSGFLMLCIIVPAGYGLPPVHGISLKAWLALAASGVLCTAASTFLWNYGMAHIPASQAGIFLNMEPLIGSILGIALLSESLGPTGITGGLMILLAAITLTTKSKARTKDADIITT